MSIDGLEMIADDGTFELNDDGERVLDSEDCAIKVKHNFSGSATVGEFLWYTYPYTDGAPYQFFDNFNPVPAALLVSGPSKTGWGAPGTNGVRNHFRRIDRDNEYLACACKGMLVLSFIDDNLDQTSASGKSLISYVTLRQSSGLGTNNWLVFWNEYPLADTSMSYLRSLGTLTLSNNLLPQTLSTPAELADNGLVYRDNAHPILHNYINIGTGSETLEVTFGVTDALLVFDTLDCRPGIEGYEDGMGGDGCADATPGGSPPTYACVKVWESTLAFSVWSDPTPVAGGIVCIDTSDPDKPLNEWGPIQEGCKRFYYQKIPGTCAGSDSDCVDPGPTTPPPKPKEFAACGGGTVGNDCHNCPDGKVDRYRFDAVNNTTAQNSEDYTITGPFLVDSNIDAPPADYLCEGNWQGPSYSGSYAAFYKYVYVCHGQASPPLPDHPHSYDYN